MGTFLFSLRLSGLRPNLDLFGTRMAPSSERKALRMVAHIFLFNLDEKNQGLQELYT